MYIYSIFDASLGFIRLIRRRNLFLSYEKNFQNWKWQLLFRQLAAACPGPPGIFNSPKTNKWQLGHFGLIRTSPGRNLIKDSSLAFSQNFDDWSLIDHLRGIQVLFFAFFRVSEGKPRGGREGIVLIMAPTRKLSPKGVPFSGFRYMKRFGLWKGSKGLTGPFYCCEKVETKFFFCDWFIF